MSEKPRTLKQCLDYWKDKKGNKGDNNEKSRF